VKRNDFEVVSFEANDTARLKIAFKMLQQPLIEAGLL